MVADPRAGALVVAEHAAVAGLSLTAEKMAGRRHRIATVIAHRLEPEAEEETMPPYARRLLEPEQASERGRV